MKAYFGLGSNLGDRRQHMARAVQLMRQAGLRNPRLSPLVETPALLPIDAPTDWNRPFLNAVLEGEPGGTPQEWLKTTKQIQYTLGRVPQGSKWSPRPMDIDLLLWGDSVIHEEDLEIPHPDMRNRAFVMVPLAHLAPTLLVPGRANTTALQAIRELPHKIPLWMGIINVSPDSFSDHNLDRSWEAIETRLDEMIRSGVHIIDFGAESTRPGAIALSSEQEWQRLEPVLKAVIDKFAGALVMPQLSVDTYHAATARRAIELGVDFINDVSGLTQPEMLKLAAQAKCQWIAMHSTRVPVDAGVRLSTDQHPVKQLKQWLRERLHDWHEAGLDLAKLSFDPGIGFGKDSLQSLELLRHIDKFSHSGLRVLVGHSRKSFMSAFADIPPAQRDLETIGASLKLCNRNVDIIRVHNVPDHLRAYRAWAHLQAYT